MKFFGLNRKQEKALSPVSSRGGWWPVIREAFTGGWQRNQEVKAADLLASPVVYACITQIANDVGKLRARLVEKDADDIWTETKGASPFWPVLRKPNRFQNHIQFKQWWFTSKQRAGNTYALKERDARGVVVRLYVLQPESVTPLVSDDGSIFYQLAADNLAGIKTSVTVPASEIIHDRMNCLYHPLVGMSPLHAAAIAAGVGVKIQENTLQFFGNNAMPGGILVAPGNISPDNAKALKEQWQSGYTGANAGQVAVLGDGLKFEPLGRNAVDSQLIETLRWTDERVCTVFRVPGYKIGVGQAPTYNNIEALDRAYYSDCLQIHIEEFEACMDEGLGLDGVNKGIELDLDGLMRMDSKTLMETLSEGVRGRVFTPNNARKRVNLPPLTGGDTVYMQQQDYPLDQVRLNKIASEPAPSPAPAEPSEQDKALIAWAKAQEATDKAIEAMRKAAQPEATNDV